MGESESVLNAIEYRSR